MASRAMWKGQLRLSLVSIPVELHSAKKSGARVSFRQIHRPSGRPVHYQKVVNGLGPVNPEDIAKGYEMGDDRFILFDEDEIAEIKLEKPPQFSECRQLNCRIHNLLVNRSRRAKPAA